MIPRILPLPPQPRESFFLWGPRQVGKSSVLAARYPHAHRVDLLRTDDYLRYLQRPALLRDELRDMSSGTLVVIDEVQKVPALLDEVHWLIEHQRLVFALCGSSARKMRRGHANLLGGRAVRYELLGFVSKELGSTFDLVRAANHGVLPRHYLADRPTRMVRAYVDDYLTSEIAAEALVRSVPSFAGFLRSAAIGDTELVNFQNIARECAVTSPTVKEYYQILVDTLLGRFVPAFTVRPKRRVIQAPKFYFADVGVVNHLAQRGIMAPGSELFGKALESLICHELSAFREYHDRAWTLSYWRLASGIEVDFVLGDAEIAIEVKSSPKIATPHLKGLIAFGEDQPAVRRRIMVCLEPRRRVTKDGIEILPVGKFLESLWRGEIG
ncbi:MAG: ATP-binding protein [Gemmatimonadaceae bacterium]|nr:ATP-binding protein [Gemmatimonadaceae bacterium]